MSDLDIGLVVLNVVFWGGNVIYYFRLPIYHWLDGRIHYEPVTDRLRALFRSGRK